MKPERIKILKRIGTYGIILKDAEYIVIGELEPGHWMRMESIGHDSIQKAVDAVHHLLNATRAMVRELNV